MKFIWIYALMNIPFLHAVDDHVVYFYGATTFETIPDASELGAKTIIISQVPGNCRDIALQEKLVMDQSSDWIELRTSGKRRIASRNLIFFQFKGLNFTVPYIKREESASQKHFYYDPFELLGYFYFRYREMKCWKQKLEYNPKWIFGARDFSQDFVDITEIPPAHEKYRYVETFSGYPTDIYFCRRKISPEKLDEWKSLLRAVQESQRIEGSDPFKNYTQFRESTCGET